MYKIYKHAFNEYINFLHYKICIKKNTISTNWLQKCFVPHARRNCRNCCVASKFEDHRILHSIRLTSHVVEKLSVSVHSI